MDSLKKLTSPRAVVRRDSVVREIAGCGTGVRRVCDFGDRLTVPADLRLVQAWNLKIEESALTGESVPVEKTSEKPVMGKTAVGERKNEAFMSTLVTAGHGEGIVTATGMQSEIGKVAIDDPGGSKRVYAASEKTCRTGEIAQCRFHITLCAAVRDCGPAKRNVMEC